MPTNGNYNNESKELDTAVVSEKTPFWCPDHQKWEAEPHRPSVTGTEQKDFDVNVKKSIIQEFGRIMLKDDDSLFSRAMSRVMRRQPDTGGVINSPGSGDYNTGQWHSPEVPNVEGHYPYNIEPGADHSHGVGSVNRNESPEHSHGVGPFRARGEAPFKSDRFHRHGGNPIEGFKEGFKGGREGGYWGTKKPRWRLTAEGRAIPRDESSKPLHRMGERVGARYSDELSDVAAEAKMYGRNVKDMWGEDVKRGAKAAGRGVDAALHAVEDTKSAAGRGARKVGRGAEATARAYARSNDPMMFSLQRMFLTKKPRYDDPHNEGWNEGGTDINYAGVDPDMYRDEGMTAGPRRTHGYAGHGSPKAPWEEDQGQWGDPSTSLTARHAAATAARKEKDHTDFMVRREPMERYPDMQVEQKSRGIEKNTNGEGWDPATQNPPIPRMAYMRQQPRVGGKWGSDWGPKDMTSEEAKAQSQALLDTIRYSDQMTKPQHRALRNSIEKNTNLPMPSNEDTGGTDEIGRASASRKPKGFHDSIFGNEPDKQELIDSLNTGKEHEVKVPKNIQNMARIFRI